MKSLINFLLFTWICIVSVFIITINLDIKQNNTNIKFIKEQIINCNNSCPDTIFIHDTINTRYYNFKH